MLGKEMSALRMPMMNWKQRLVAVLGLAWFLSLSSAVVMNAELEVWFVLKSVSHYYLWLITIEWLWGKASKPPKPPARPLSADRGGLPSREDETIAWRLRNAEGDAAIQITPGDQTGHAKQRPDNA
ncbi:MAG: hypothetical protein JHC87_01515 [Thermoleophilaceae bacterium]|nr:hypothetical protein [Thermoleophilaceae bacterium]